MNYDGHVNGNYLLMFSQGKIILRGNGNYQENWGLGFWFKDQVCVWGGVGGRGGRKLQWVASIFSGGVMSTLALLCSEKQ